MPGQIDKAIITNRAATDAKYGAVGAAAIRQAAQRLIAADAVRNLTTEIFEIDDLARMTPLGGAAVVNAADEAGAKAAVDAIYAHHTPDYILLLDGPDVVPHITLNKVAGVTDSDQAIASDLPYACDAAFNKKAQTYLGVTRVVGRLPAAAGETDPQRLITLIDHSIQHIGKPRTDYLSYFSISTEVWKQSTQLSLSSLFGNHAALFVAPTDGHPGIDPSIGKLVHFINCHGANSDPRFYGEGAGVLPTAMDSQFVQAPRVTAGTVVAAECCFGAQLYNYLMLGHHAPICMSYLANGATAYLGSTTISYGPRTTNGQADLLAQYFVEGILAGASTGRAMLQARQQFVQSQTMASPINLKTLAQFVLYGDPSLQPVTDAAPVQRAASELAGGASPLDVAVDGASQRKFRRTALASEGKAIASSASLPGKILKTDDGSPAIKRFRELASSKGYDDGKLAVLSVTGGAQFKSAAKAMDRERQVVIATRPKGKFEDTTGTERFSSYEVLVGHILGDGIFAVEQCESR